jgi:DNA-binding winged helix-turn-helix (wHTH) protein/anti-sigma regulatory factor (Ser/Thr protein kinase)
MEGIMTGSMSTARESSFLPNGRAHRDLVSEAMGQLKNQHDSPPALTLADPVDRSSTRAVSFGPFRLFPTQRLLLRADKAVPLGSRALDILIALVERPGELFTKDELMARVWANTFVEPGNLTVHIAALRRALCDGRDGNRFVVNIPGRGYQFVAPVAFTADLQPSALPAAAVKHQHNLPARLTRTIGRADIMSELSERLPQSRLITTAGLGGIGKTSVALAAAEQLVEDCKLSASDLVVPIRAEVDVIIARQRARELASELRFSSSELTAIATAISEVTRNIVIYSGTGEIVLRIVEQGQRRGLMVFASDRGPGIADIERAVQDGYSTSHGLGIGLPGSKRLMDEFAVSSEVDKGTVVTMTKWER